MTNECGKPRLRFSSDGVFRMLMMSDIQDVYKRQVQLGMNYGIANTTGQPAEEESFAMLGAAHKGGVSSIDTARVYGNSEDVIGHFFRQYDGELPFITTKVPKIEGETEGEIEKFVVSSVETSLEKLGVPRVNLSLIHI